MSGLRRFQVQIDDTKSKEIELPFSVPQGSCAGPVLYSADASTLQEVIQDPDGSSSSYKPIDLHGPADDHAYKNCLQPNQEQMRPTQWVS